MTAPRWWVWRDGPHLAPGAGEALCPLGEYEEQPNEEQLHQGPGESGEYKKAGFCLTSLVFYSILSPHLKGST